MNRVFAIILVAWMLMPISASAGPYDGFDIYYVNGVWNSIGSATQSVGLLRYDVLQDESRPGDVRMLYNRGEGWMADLWQTTKQAYNEGKFHDIGQYRLWLASPADAPQWFLDAQQVLTGRYYNEQALAGNPDLLKMATAIAQFPTLNNKKLLVCHSQGNLFCNQLMRLMQANPDVWKCTGMVSVATPATNVGGRFPPFPVPVHWTKENDRVINLARTGLPWGSAILPPNPPGVTFSSQIDPFNHAFASYVESLATGIRSSIALEMDRVRQACDPPPPPPPPPQAIGASYYIEFGINTRGGNTYWCETYDSVLCYFDEDEQRWKCGFAVPIGEVDRYGPGECELARTCRAYALARGGGAGIGWSLLRGLNHTSWRGNKIKYAVAGGQVACGCSNYTCAWGASPFLRIRRKDSYGAVIVDMLPYKMSAEFTLPE